MFRKVGVSSKDMQYYEREMRDQINDETLRQLLQSMADIFSDKRRYNWQATIYDTDD